MSGPLALFALILFAGCFVLAVAAVTWRALDVAANAAARSPKDDSSSR